VARGLWVRSRSGSPLLSLSSSWDHAASRHTSVLTEYRLIGKKGEGTFSEVLKAQCIKNGKYVAIKCMKNHFDSLEQARNRCPQATMCRVPSMPVFAAGEQSA